jgi:uncharacterized protein (TIRG00374 family)
VPDESSLERDDVHGRPPHEVAVAEAIAESGREPSLLRRHAGRVFFVVVTGISLYLVLPSLTEVFASWPRLSRVEPIWLGALVVAQVGSLVSLWALQRIVLRDASWFVVSTSQLVANAISRVVPAGGPAGAAAQFRMLTRAGYDAGNAASGLTALGLLQLAGIFALPVLTLPTILFGRPVDQSLAAAAWLGALVFIVMIGAGALLLRSERLMTTVGRAVETVHNRVRRRAPIEGLGERLRCERDLVRESLGARPWHALLFVAGRLGLEYFVLLGALAAIGSDVDPSLVLLAYAATGIFAMIPLTPGGLGFVEAGLTATLALAGVSGGDAVFATLVYRLITHWLPLLAAPVAYGVFALRMRGRPSH